MVQVPDPLARSVAAQTHDAVVLRIRPVLRPPDGALVLLLLASALALLPVLAASGLALLWFGLLVSDPEVLAIGQLLLAGGIVAVAAVGVPLGSAVRGIRCTDLSLSAHAIRGTVVRGTGRSTVTIPLAELESVAVEGEAIRFVRRDGEAAVIPVPERSRATYEALDRWLGQVAERAEALGRPVDVPDAMRRLRERQPEGG